MPVGYFCIKTIQNRTSRQAVSFSPDPCCNTISPQKLGEKSCQSTTTTAKLSSDSKYVPTLSKDIFKNIKIFFWYFLSSQYTCQLLYITFSLQCFFLLRLNLYAFKAIRQIALVPEQNNHIWLNILMFRMISISYQFSYCSALLHLLVSALSSRFQSRKNKQRVLRQSVLPQKWTIEV